MTAFRAFHIITIAALFIGSTQARANDTQTVQVAGSGFDALNTAIVHSKVITQTGMIQNSTEIVELKGDLTGKVLYHVTSVFDFVNGTLVNSGNQVYSGTIAGSDPVMIHDDQFRFDVNLATGEESGQVYLFDGRRRSYAELPAPNEPDAIDSRECRRRRGSTGYNHRRTEDP